MSTADIGLIGLGVMGSNLALNMAEKGFRVAVYNRTVSRTTEFVAEAGALKSNLVGCMSMQELVAAIRPPRPVIIMVKAGDPVDQQIAALRPLMAENDIIIDAGNANFRDTMRRFKELEGSGLTFIGMGVSGGEEGARHGPSIMVGGAERSWQRIKDVLLAIAAKYKGEPCAAWLGPDGAGHFVKTIHNGIEYADMQMIAEIYGLMDRGLALKPQEAAEVFARWNEGQLESYLIEITSAVLKAVDPATGRPMVDVILDSAGQKGTGRWAVIEAQMMGVPATAIEAAVAARSLSAMKAERVAAAALYGSKGPARLSIAQDELERALLAGKIIAYAQGFAVMQQASREFGWNLPMQTIARIWRAGCIIRSRFLDLIAMAYGQPADLPSLLTAPSFVAMLQDSVPALRKVVAAAVAASHPVPALAAALGNFDGYTEARGTASLLQAQRDFFGAHGFERIDTTGPQHGPWASPQ